MRAESGKCTALPRAPIGSNGRRSEGYRGGGALRRSRYRLNRSDSSSRHAGDVFRSEQDPGLGSRNHLDGRRRFHQPAILGRTRGLHRTTAYFATLRTIHEKRSRKTCTGSLQSYSRKSNQKRLTGNPSPCRYFSLAGGGMLTSRCRDKNCKRARLRWTAVFR